jgi:hypothetical protein
LLWLLLLLLLMVMLLLLLLLLFLLQSGALFTDNSFALMRVAWANEQSP